MQILTRTLFGGDNEPTWATGAKKSIEIPLDRYISQIDLRANAVYDGAAGAAKAQDGILNLIDRVDLILNGTTVRSWKPSRRWYQAPLDYGVVPEFVDVTTTVANGKKGSFHLPMPFRLNPRNPLDVAALLPAKYLSSAKLDITFGATAALGANQTITSGGVQLTLHERILSAAEERRFYGVSGPRIIENSGLLQVMELEQTKTVDAAYADYSFAMSLPSGSRLRRSFLYATLNALRDDTLITKYRVKDDRGQGYVYTDESWIASQMRDLAEYGPPKALEGDLYLKGFTVLDYEDYAPFGLDLRGVNANVVKLYASTIANVGTTNVALLNESIAPVAFAG